jgi:hypothetical protein
MCRSTVGPRVTTWIDDNTTNWTPEGSEVWEFSGQGVF